MDISLYSKIFYSTSTYIILRNVFMVITGLLSIFIIRLLTPVEYGKWALVWQLIGTIGPIVNMGFLSTLAKFIPECTDEERKKKLFSQALFVVICAFLVFSLIYISGTSLFSRIIPQEIKVVKYPFLFFIGALALINLFEGYYRGMGRFNQWTIIDGGRSVLSAGLAVFLLLFVFSDRFQVVFYTYFIITMVFLIILLSRLAGRVNFNHALNIDPKIIKFSLIMLTGQIVFLLGTTLDSVLLRALLKDPAEVGYYNVGIRIPKMLEVMFIGPLSVPFLYYFSHPETSQNREKILEFGSKMLGIVFGLVSLFLFSFSKEIILLLFGQDYSDSILVLRIFSLALFILGFLILFSPYFVSLNRPLIVVLVGIVNVTFMVIFNLILIPYLKSSAPAVSTVLSLCIFTFVLLCLIPENRVNIFKNFIILFFCALIAVILGFYFSFYLSFPMFLISILLTQLLAIEDIKTFKKIAIKRLI